MSRDVWKYVGTLIILDYQGREMLTRKKSFASDDVVEIFRMLINYALRFNAPGNCARITLFDCDKRKYVYQLQKFF